MVAAVALAIYLMAPLVHQQLTLSHDQTNCEEREKLWKGLGPDL